MPKITTSLDYDMGLVQMELGKTENPDLVRVKFSGVDDGSVLTADMTVKVGKLIEGLFTLYPERFIHGQITE